MQIHRGDHSGSLPEGIQGQSQHLVHLSHAHCTTVPAPSGAPLTTVVDAPPNTVVTDAEIRWCIYVGDKLIESTDPPLQTTVSKSVPVQAGEKKPDRPIN